METVDRVEVFKSILLSATISLWLYWLWTRRDFYRFSLKFPGFLSLPIIGSLVRIKSINQLIPAFGKMFQDCKQHTLCVWMGLYPVVLTDDPNFIEKILSSADMLNKSKVLYTPIFNAFGGGIIASPATVWHHHRKMINPSFHHKVLVGFLPIFNKAKNLTVKRINSMVDNEEHKLVAMLQRVSLGITVETTMGKVMLVDDEVDAVLAEKFSFGMEKIILQCMLSFLNLAGLFNLYRKYQQTLDFLRKFVLELIEQKISKANDSCEDNNNMATRQNGEEDLVDLKKTPNIFIDQAIQIYQKQQFSMEDIVSESNTIVTASFETTANGVFSTLVMMAMHPDVQERLYEEIVNVFPEKMFEMEYEDMQQLPYLDMVINETLRLAPSVPLIARHVVKDTQLSKDLILPKNIQIMISIFHLHRRTDIWGPNANKFDPDNFLPENLTGKHSHAYIPFSKGIRNCIGWRYALFAMKVMLAGLIRNYRFTTSFEYDNLKFVDNIALKYLDEPMLKMFHRQ